MSDDSSSQTNNELIANLIAGGAHFDGTHLRHSGCYYSKALPNNKGYLSCQIHIPGTKVRKHILLSRFLCWQFNGPPPEGKPYVDHENRNHLDNSPTNLRWVSRKENNKLPSRELGDLSRKLTDEQVIEMRRLFELEKHPTKDAAFKSIGERFGVHHSSVRRAIVKDTFKQVI